MTLFTDLILFGFLGAFGTVLHELAHYTVWRVAGRDPIIKAERSFMVCPRRGPTHVTPADRLAAVAPYVLGVGMVGLGIVLNNMWWWVLALGLLFPSGSDIQAMLGKAEWDLPAAT